MNINYATTAQGAYPIVLATYEIVCSKYPDAAQFLSLGNNLTVELGGTVYDIVEEATPTPQAK